MLMILADNKPLVHYILISIQCAWSTVSVIWSLDCWMTTRTTSTLVLPVVGSSVCICSVSYVPPSDGSSEKWTQDNIYHFLFDANLLLWTTTWICWHCICNSFGERGLYNQTNKMWPHLGHSLRLCFQHQPFTVLERLALTDSWVFLCLVRWSLLMNLLSHCGHWNFFSP